MNHGMRYVRSGINLNCNIFRGKPDDVHNYLFSSHQAHVAHFKDSMRHSNATDGRHCKSYYQVREPHLLLSTLAHIIQRRYYEGHKWLWFCYQCFIPRHYLQFIKKKNVFKGFSKAQNPQILRELSNYSGCHWNIPYPASKLKLSSTSTETAPASHFSSFWESWIHIL